jgi:hypothetical protein
LLRLNYTLANSTNKYHLAINLAQILNIYYPKFVDSVPYVEKLQLKPLDFDKLQESLKRFEKTYIHFDDVSLEQLDKSSNHHAFAVNDSSKKACSNSSTLSKTIPYQVPKKTALNSHQQQLKPTQAQTNQNIEKNQQNSNQVSNLGGKDNVSSSKKYVFKSSVSSTSSIENKGYSNEVIQLNEKNNTAINEGVHF